MGLPSGRPGREVTQLIDPGVAGGAGRVEHTGDRQRCPRVMRRAYVVTGAARQVRRDVVGLHPRQRRTRMGGVEDVEVVEQDQRVIHGRAGVGVGVGPCREQQREYQLVEPIRTGGIGDSGIGGAIDGGGCVASPIRAGAAPLADQPHTGTRRPVGSQRDELRHDPLRETLLPHGDADAGALVEELVEVRHRAGIRWVAVRLGLLDPPPCCGHHRVDRPDGDTT